MGKCSFQVQNNLRSMHDFPAYIFTCKHCGIQKIVTKRWFWR
jgi:hypothetical protein